MRHADSSERDRSQMKDNERRITDLGKQAAAQVHISTVAFAACITFDLCVSHLGLSCAKQRKVKVLLRVVSIVEHKSSLEKATCQ